MNQEKLVKLLQEVEKSLKKSGNSNVWDEYCPIVSKDNEYFVYLTSQIDEPSVYNKLLYMLNNANEYDNFIFIINSLGGMLDSTFMIIDAIKSTKAKTECRLSGTVASAATIIALSCNELKTSKGLSFMIHNYSSAGVQGKGHEMKARQNFIDRELNKSFREYYLGFLTEDEIVDIIDGKDIWLNNDEVEIRWKDKCKYLLKH